MRIFKSRLFAACAASVITALAVGGVAWAVQSPVDGAGVVHGCYNPSTGAFKLNVAGGCPAKGDTTPISWNAQGPQGATGPAGPQGLVGPQGPAGATVNTCASPPGPNLNFSFCDLSSGKFTYADLHGTLLISAILNGRSFVFANLRNANLTNAAATYANFNGADFSNAVLINTYLHGSILFSANLSGANFRNADITFTNIGSADLHGTDFTNADLSDATGGGANLLFAIYSNTICPDHTDSDNNGGTCFNHA